MKKIIIPDSDKAGMFIVKKIIKHCSNKRLLDIDCYITKYPDSQEKQEIQELIDKEYEKRKMTQLY